MKYVKNNDIGKVAKNGYDDRKERNALKRFLHEDKDFRDYIFNTFKLNKELKYRLVPDPLGKKKVDLGIVESVTGKLVGLIEVDYFNAWKKAWPKFYKYHHILERKDKYWINNDYPYVAVTFNVLRDRMIVTDRETIIKYPVINKEFKSMKKYDRVRELPLHESKFFGKSIDKSF